jgi:crotonobetainyl-CoA:carnitine CoA-transferase CaiB-like acyl-CoA transferase
MLTTEDNPNIAQPLLTGLRIVVVDAGLAGGYAGKLFADQGADVVHIEPLGGTELSRRSAEAGSPAGAVYRHLTAGTRRIQVDASESETLSALRAIILECDAVILDAVGAGLHPTLTLEQITPWCVGSVLANISLWGKDATHADWLGNEFTLQVAVGGTGSRGGPDTPPLSADGDRGFWHTGAYTAVGVLAALGTAPADRPKLLDISAFECMVTAWNLFEWIRRVLWESPRDMARWTDVPGIERALDGWVGFSLVTPSQWRSYCEMTESPQLASEPAFQQLTGRSASHERIREATDPWMSKHTVEEIVAQAGARRIPAVPVVPAGRLSQMEHFRERHTFVPASHDLPERPAPPFKVDGVRRYRNEPVNELSTADSVWPARDDTPQSLDLSELAVLDVTAFYAGPYATQVLAMLGADVVHVEAPERYDGMRNVAQRPRTQDNWWEFAYVYQGAQAGKRSLALDLGQPKSSGVLDRLLSKYDVVLENFSLDVAPRLGLVYEELLDRNPGTIFLRSPGFGLDGPWSPLRAFAMTGDQISGLAWRTGWEGGRPTSPRTIGDSFTALHSAFVVLAALRRRASTGRGAFIEMSSMEVSINLTAEESIEWSAHGIEMGRTGNRSRRIAPQGVYAAAGDDVWLALSVDTDEAWRGLLQGLGEKVAAKDAVSWSVIDRVARHDEIDAWINAWASELSVESAVATLQAQGVAAEPVPLASRVAEDVRLRRRGYFFPFEHPIAGRLDYTGLPWLIDGHRPGPSGPAPLFGQDTEDVLSEVGIGPEEIALLTEEGVVGGHPPVDRPPNAT